MANYIHLPEAPGIYQILNRTTQKRYIGYSVNIRERISKHYSELNNNNHDNDYLQKAWFKYGKEDFVTSTLQLCLRSKLCLYEDYWVKILKTTDEEFGYNLRDTDPNGKVGHSKKTIEKLRAINKGKSSESSLKALKNYWTTHTMSDDHKKACKAGLKRVDWFELRKDKCKPVINRITGEVYESAKRAIEISGISKTTLYHKLGGSRMNNTDYQYL